MVMQDYSFGSNMSRAETVAALRNGIIGQHVMSTTPFGQRPCVYADWTASGRALRQIESFITDEVLPYYGNTHTATSITGRQTTHYRHESRQIIAESVNAKTIEPDARDVVLFTGSGTTAAIAKIVQSLGLHVPLPEEADESLRPVVFTSSYEHHSNLLPWRESVADVVTIDLSPATGVCLTHLREELQKYQHRKLKIGAFSAASNVTGMMTAVDDVSILMHKFGGVVIFDYATAAPYVKMDMNPVLHCEDAELAYKDAIVMSGHKFLGGPGASGVLVAKKHLIWDPSYAPTLPGGGTVLFVTSDHQRYLPQCEEREEAGTPNIIGDIRMGLSMLMKHNIGAEWIEAEEIAIAKKVYADLCTHPNICILRTAPSDAPVPHLPTFSFLIRFTRSQEGTSALDRQQSLRFLHYNFVCALLNDLFGIQCRGGCMCAGPYSIQLLGISASDSQLLETALLDKVEVLRPGYTRLSLPYWMSTQEIDYVVNAVKFVADYGYKFLPVYRCDQSTGSWAHEDVFNAFPGRRYLSSIIDPTGISASENLTSRGWEFDDFLGAALGLAETMPQYCEEREVNCSSLLRWFVISPQEQYTEDVVIVRPGLKADIDCHHCCGRAQAQPRYISFTSHVKADISGNGANIAPSQDNSTRSESFRKNLKKMRKKLKLVLKSFLQRRTNVSC